MFFAIFVAFVVMTSARLSGARLQMRRKLGRQTCALGTLDPPFGALTWGTAANHRDDLLAFAAQLDRDLTALATAFEIHIDRVRQMLDLQRLDPRQPLRWQKAAALRQQIRPHQFQALSAAVQDVADRVVRSSSVIENLNSRLRGYFFLRREVGPGYLTLLQFFLNHRRFLRSEHRERVDKSPAELLTGQRHPHWLEMLGYQQFQRPSAN